MRYPDSETHSQILGGTQGTLWKRGERNVGVTEIKKTMRAQSKESTKQGSQGITETGATIRVFMDLNCFYSLVSCGTTLVGLGSVSDSFFCSWDAFPPTRFLCPSLLWVFVPSLISTWYAVLVWHHWGPCSFLKGNREGVDLVEMGWELGETMVGM